MKLVAFQNDAFSSRDVQKLLAFLLCFLLCYDVIIVCGRGLQTACWVETSCAFVVVVYEGEMDSVVTGSREKMRR